MTRMRRQPIGKLLRRGGARPVAAFLADFWNQRALRDDGVNEPYGYPMDTNPRQETDDELAAIRAEIEQVRHPTAECPVCHSQVRVDEGVLHRHAVLYGTVEMYCKGSGARL